MLEDREIDLILEAFDIFFESTVLDCDERDEYRKLEEKLRISKIGSHTFKYGHKFSPNGQQGMNPEYCWYCDRKE